MAHCQLSNLIKKQFWVEKKKLDSLFEATAGNRDLELSCALCRKIGNIQQRSDILLCELCIQKSFVFFFFNNILMVHLFKLNLQVLLNTLNY